jgi:hypothetical protein
MAATDIVTTRARARIISESVLLFATLAAYAVWQLGGQIDTWYHAHYGFEIESFVTWPHALLYAGWVASSTPAVLYLIESRSLGAPRDALLPPGYPLVILGAAGFGVGGILDLAWHNRFGFEVGHEALVSPTHLVLIYSSGVGVIGLLWAALAWRSRAQAVATGAGNMAIALSLGLLLKVLLFAFLYSLPFSTDYASEGAIARNLFGFSGIGAWSDMTAQVAGTTGMILYGILVALFVTVPLRRLRLPAGAIATIVLWVAALMCVATPELWIYLPAALAAALVGETLWMLVRRGSFGGPDGRIGYWLIAFAVPATQLYAYFALMAAFGGGISWSTSLWTGAPLLAGVYGLVATVFAIPPRFAEAP